MHAAFFRDMTRGELKSSLGTLGRKTKNEVIRYGHTSVERHDAHYSQAETHGQATALKQEILRHLELVELGILPKQLFHFPELFILQDAAAYTENTETPSVFINGQQIGPNGNVHNFKLEALHL